ncbi:MAG: glycosyltransferase family 39 protein [bacterium]
MPVPPVVPARRWKLLIVLSGIFILFNISLHFKDPPHDGDSFEYAGISRNILRTGGLREDLLRSYAIVNQPLPHPPSQRANLYVYFLVPFYAVFKDTHWTFLIPSLIGLFLLPLVIYHTGRRLFSDNAGFYAAILTLFLPALLRLYFLMDPGLPEAWQMIFYLLFVLYLLEERFVIAGILMALAFLFRQNSVILIPAAIIWLAALPGKRLFRLATVKLFAVAFILVLPFLIRSWLVFGTPMYNEQVEGAAKVYDGTLRDHFERARMFGIVFNYDAYHNAPAHKNVSVAVRAENFAAIVWANMKMAVLGKKSDIMYIPGILQTIGLLMIPFFALGARSGRASPAVRLILIIIALQALMHIVMITYADRYILCVMPLVFMICAAGAEDFQKRASLKFPRLSDRRLIPGIIAFIILTESAGLIMFDIGRLASDPGKNIYREQQTTCEYIKRHTKPGSVVMTYPFFSTHFICDRYTAPLPYGPMSTAAEIIKKYDVKYLLYAATWPGDRFPDLPFAVSVSRGMTVSLLKINPSLLDSYLVNHASFPMDKFNLADYFLSGRFNFEFAPPLYKILANFARGVPAGIILYCASFFLFIWIFLRRPGFTRSLLLVILSAAFLFCHGFQLYATFSPLLRVAPPMSKIQSELLAKRFPPDMRLNLIVSAPDSKTANQAPANAAASADRESLSKYFKHSTLSRNPPERIPDNAALFVPLPPAESWLSDYPAFLANVESQKRRRELLSDTIRKYGGKGVKTAPVYGGVFFYRTPTPGE